MRKCFRMLFLLLNLYLPEIKVQATTWHVGITYDIRQIKTAIQKSFGGDTIIVYKGLYKEGNIIINKSLCIIGNGNPVIDGENKYEIFSVKVDNVTLRGFTVQNSGYSTLTDPGAIKVYDSNNIIIENNLLKNNFFGIYIQYGKNCLIKNNTITSNKLEEQQIGNGIHGWKSDSLQIIGNHIKGHRDGIYFEFVTHSIIWRNISTFNLRYGLHFMFSNHDAYISNYFEHNGAGVAVMFSNHVVMYNNNFQNNWGDATYGILLKEISDAEIIGNVFYKNTSALYLEGANRIHIEKNSFQNNGWGMKIQASCMDNIITKNNFIGNSFDISTNGSLVLNTFNENFWDKYEGYDLNKDTFGDIPYHPLSLFCVLVEKNPVVMLLYRSFMVSLLDKSEKLMPSLTPDNFVDSRPVINAYSL